MGFLRDLGGAALNGVQKWNERAMEYYDKAMDMDDERLLREFERAKRDTSNKARLAGYYKAVQERGLS